MPEYQSRAFLVDRDRIHRCPHCRWKFAFGDIKKGTSLSVKCPKCKEVFNLGDAAVSRREMRCPNCHRMLAKGDLGAGSSIEMKCTRCGLPVPWTRL